MNTNLLLLTIFIGTNCLADSSIVADIKAYQKLQREDASGTIPLPKRLELMEKMKIRAETVVGKEFALLADNEISVLAHDLLNDSATIDFCRVVLRNLLQIYPVEVQINILKKVFTDTPDSQRGNSILALCTELPRAAFSGEEIQKWLVDNINGGMPAGVYYFVLTEESAYAVTTTAIASMKRFSKAKGPKEGNLFSLLSAVFLASRGDDNAAKLLDSLLEKRVIDSLFDIDYVIPAAAMSGNEKLIQKIRDIALTDKRVRFNGHDCDPPESSFAHEAAIACSLTIEGFPTVKDWEYDQETKKKVHDWLGKNPTHKVKPNDARVFLKGNFQSVITSMWRANEGE